jgi:hypothetical protein
VTRLSMSINFTYNISLKRGETRKLDLPNLKIERLILRKFTINSEHKSFDIKIVGKETIISYGEAVFYQATNFDLIDQVAQIVDADNLTMTVKNLCSGKDANTVNITIILSYEKTEGSIIYNNTYTNLNSEGLAGIVEDIRKAGKHITKIVWTSPNKLASFELKPQFESDPQWIQARTLLANKQNQVILDLSDDQYDSDFISQLKYYNLSVSDNLEKLGVIVYGYVN